MSEHKAPILFAPSLKTAKYSNLILSKILIASLTRSLFNGSIHTFRNHEMPLFKLERKSIEEVLVSMALREDQGADGRSQSMEFLVGLENHLKMQLRQWVIITDSAGLALRNIDHLIAADSNEPHAPPEVDFYWTKVLGRSEGGGEVFSSPGLWAVRGEHLPMVLQMWEKEWNELREREERNETAVWSRVVRNLPLRKKPFEKGEVYAPEIGSVDWGALSNAAFVTVPDWPEDEQRKFLQALYFGTYFGDETGLMLNILDP